MQFFTIARFALGWALAASGAVHAQLSEPLLGIQLGKPLALGSCADQRDTWCFAKAPYGSQHFKLAVLSPPEAPAALPEWMRRDKMLLELDGAGVARKFFVKTYGAPVQDAVLQTLTRRFGAPQLLEVEQLRNAAGKTVEVKYARWMTADAVLTHSCSVVNTCTVSISTAAAHQAFLEEWKNRTQSRMQKNMPVRG